MIWSPGCLPYRFVIVVYTVLTVLFCCRFVIVVYTVLTVALRGSSIHFAASVRTLERRYEKHCSSSRQVAAEKLLSDAIAIASKARTTHPVWSLDLTSQNVTELLVRYL